MNQKNIIATVVILAALIGLGYAAQRGGSSTDSGDTIKVGFIGPLTGDAAVYGEPMKNAVAMAAEEINADGGGDGKKFEFVYEDTKCNGKDATNAMQKLIRTD